MPEDLKSFLKDQWQVRELVAVSIRMLLQFDSDDRFSKDYAMESARGLCTFHA